MVDDRLSFPAYPVADTRFGRMFTLRGDRVIGRSLRFYGEFAGDEVDSILMLVRPGDHVLDVGANIGFHTLALAQAVGPGGAVTAFEPQRHCFQLLCANVTANQHRHVDCRRAAVGDASGICAIPLHDPLTRHNAGATAVQTDGTAGTEPVAMVTLDSLALSRCDLVKIDTEGHEVAVLAGARDLLNRLHPVIYAEVHSTEKLHATANLLRPLGYRLVLHHCSFFRANNPMGEGASIFPPGAGGSALIGLPPGRTLPEGLPGKLQSVD